MFLKTTVEASIQYLKFTRNTPPSLFLPAPALECMCSMDVYKSKQKRVGVMANNPHWIGHAYRWREVQIAHFTAEYRQFPSDNNA